MNLINTNDPTTIGVLIMSALVVVGVYFLNRLIGPLRGLDSKRGQQKDTLFTKLKSTSLKSAHRKRTAYQTATPSNICAIATTTEEASFEDTQWCRITDRIDDNIDRIKRAAHDQALAVTQMDAAEFSLSELFREFPDARNQINPVTYLEFPALKARRPGDTKHASEHGTQAASA